MGYDQGAVSVIGDIRGRSMRDTEARFISRGQPSILKGQQRLLWPFARRVGVRSPSGALFWVKCIERLRCFAFNTDGILVEVVEPTIFMRDPFLHLKRGKKGPTVDEREQGPPRSRRGTRMRLL